MSLALLGNRTLIAFAAVVAVYALGSATTAGFSSAFSIRAMLILASLLAIASLGQTLVMILGGIDLSIPFVIGFANVAFATLHGDGMAAAPALVVVLALSAGIGAASGALSCALAIHPLIVTLGVGTVVLAMAQLWTGGLPSGSAPEFVNRFVSLGGSIGPIPVPWIVPFTLALTLLTVFVLHRSTFGRRLYALGSNRPDRGAVGAGEPPTDVDHRLRAERRLRRDLRRAAAGLHGLVRRGRGGSLPLPDDRGGGHRRHRPRGRPGAASSARSPARSCWWRSAPC